MRDSLWFTVNCNAAKEEEEEDDRNYTGFQIALSRLKI